MESFVQLPSIIFSEKVQSCLHSLTGRPPLVQQVACFGIALLIAIEHSYFLWAQKKSNNPAYFTTAMNLYKKSLNPDHVIKAMNEAFHEDQKVSFRWLGTSAREGARKILTNKLLKIAMDNCLSKDSLEEELKIAKEVDMKDWMD
ncbi:hypothetical protein PILCRDRAFT_473525 [Piloderma croceum F 1598]|uniref:Uncharacterized protein n=1 Tax=Piloderma croceum (strain F 1598) TaxID=765440 RepID=A0A0C3B7K9_PILCF|nr:hypothetical protein PILCRDRAFT_473525 [Piloderma croceum F 1598]